MGKYTPNYGRIGKTDMYRILTLSYTSLKFQIYFNEHLNFSLPKHTCNNKSLQSAFLQS
jgi:adenosine/AMP kinase